MDAKLAEMFRKLHEVIDRLLAFLKGEHINTMNVPLKRGDSDQIVIANLVALQRWSGVDCRQRIGGPARFLRLSSSTAGVLFIKKTYEEKREIQYREPLVAGTYYNLNDEDVLYFRVESVVFPFTVIWYMSR